MSQAVSDWDFAEKDYRFCNRCGEKYDPSSIDAPENATIYWVPSCPACNAEMTANSVDTVWMDIIGSSLSERIGKDDPKYEYHRRKVHYHARLCHGRLSDMSVDDLVERAKWFDAKVSHGTRVGPQPARDVAFALRKQAREKILRE